MLEVLFAAALVAFGILAVFLVLSHSARGAQVASRQTEGLGHARKLIDLVRSRNLAFANFPSLPGPSSGVGDPPGVRRELNAPPFDQDLPGGTGLERTIACERVSTDTSSYEFELMRITVTIHFTEGEHRRQIQVQALQARP
jgi:type II secretory pathway pseudopilin PulG